MTPLCTRCKTASAAVHFTQIVSGVVRQTDLCKACAELVGAWPRQQQRAAALLHPSKTLKVLSAKAGFTKEEYKALAYIAMCIETAHRQYPDSMLHVTAAELLSVAAEVAQKIFGDAALEELTKIGIVSSETFGRLVFSFIERGVLSKSLNDTLDDFRIHSSFDDFLRTA